VWFFLLDVHVEYKAKFEVKYKIHKIQVSTNWITLDFIERNVKKRAVVFFFSKSFSDFSFHIISSHNTIKIRGIAQQNENKL